ncbi:MAG: hypothetical protein ACYDBJ_23740 [Aggregatilineales bacterium]
MLIIYFPRLYYLWQSGEPLTYHTQPNIILGGELAQAIATGNTFPYLQKQVSQSFLGLFSIWDNEDWYGPGSNLLSPIGGPLLLMGLTVAVILLRRYPLIALVPAWAFSAVFLGSTLSAIDSQIMFWNFRIENPHSEAILVPSKFQMVF